MRKLLLVVTCLFLMQASLSAHELNEQGRFGLGAVIGYPGLGLSLNGFVADDISIETNVMGRFYYVSGLHLDVDLLFWMHESDFRPLTVTWFVGPGASIMYVSAINRTYYGGAYYSGLLGGPKGSIGLALLFNDAPVDFSIKLSPGLLIGSNGIVPWAEFLLASRFYF